MYHKVFYFLFLNNFSEAKAEICKKFGCCFGVYENNKNIFWINGPLEGRGMTSTYGSTSYEVLSPGIRK